MHSNLSLDQAPSIFTPMRFFISAPLFLVAAGFIMTLSGQEFFSSRWSPSTLAVTHAVTLGFIGMCMIGALFQILPVVTGCQLPRPEQLSPLIYVLYTPGVICLLTGFIFSSQSAFILALVLLGLALGLFLLSTAYGLINKPRNHAPAPFRGLRLSLVSLAMTLIAGGILLSGHSFDSITLLRQHTDIHIALAAIGWVSITIIAVSYQVIPMFQVTKEFPQPIQRYLIHLLMFSLLSYCFLSYFEADINISLKLPLQFSTLLITSLSIGYAVSALKLINKRKKRIPDISIWFWVTGLLCMILSMVIYILNDFMSLNLSLLIGTLFFYGSIVAIISAMLLKIIPFLTWFHLHHLLAGKGKRSDIPVMNQIINYTQARRLYGVFITSLALLVAAVFTSGAFATLAGLSVIAYGLSLQFSITNAALIFYRTRKKINNAR